MYVYSVPCTASWTDKQENSHKGESKECLGKKRSSSYILWKLPPVMSHIHSNIPNLTFPYTHTEPDKNERILTFYLTEVPVLVFLQQLLFYFMMFKGSMCTAACTHWLRQCNPPPPIHPPAFGLIYDFTIGQNIDDISL